MKAEIEFDLIGDLLVYNDEKETEEIAVKQLINELKRIKFDKKGVATKRQ
jgi:hypothetical protein